MNDQTYAQLLLTGSNQTNIESEAILILNCKQIVNGFSSETTIKKWDD